MENLDSSRYECCRWCASGSCHAASGSRAKGVRAYLWTASFWRVAEFHFVGRGNNDRADPWRRFGIVQCLDALKISTALVVP